MNIMYIIPFILAVLILVIILWIWGSRPHRMKSKRDNLAVHLRNLFTFGDDGYALWVENDGYNILAFRKCVNEEKEWIKFTFPLTQRLSKYADRVKSAFDSEEIEYLESTAKGQEAKIFDGFIDVDHIENPEKAHQIANLVLDVIGFDKDEVFTFYFEGNIKKEYNTISNVIKRSKKK